MAVNKNKVDRANLTARITIKKNEKVIVNGRPTYEDKDYYSCWARPMEFYGKELYEAINIKYNNALAFEVRYCQKIKDIRNDKDGIKPYFIEFDGSRHDVYYLDFKNDSKNKVIIKANRVI